MERDCTCRGRCFQLPATGFRLSASGFEFLGRIFAALGIPPAHRREEAQAMQDFKKLRVWQKSHGLTLDIYRATAGFPDTERFGLLTQLRKAAVSIESNLAEGSSRRGDFEFRRFVF